MLRGSDRGALKVDKWLASGAFGAVCRCRDPANNVVAVKRLRTKDAASTVGELLCLEERLVHRCLMRVQEAFMSSGRLCLCMDFVDGTELFHLAGGLSLQGAILVAEGLSAALAYLHARGFVHRDCKPENVVVRKGTRSPVLVDLGSMRPLGSRAAVEGTFAYMAPEARGQRTQIVLPELDTWSLGTTLAVVLLGLDIRTRKQAERAAKEDDVSPAIGALVLLAADFMMEEPSARQSIPGFRAALWARTGGGCEA